MTKPGDGQSKTRSRRGKTTRKVPVPKPTAEAGVDRLPTCIPCQRRPFAGFDVERATYLRLMPDLLASVEGKYVVIVGDEVVGPLESHEDAERAGYERFGLGPLYVKQVVAEEPVVEVTRLHHPWSS